MFDLQNQQLNLVELFESLIYPIWRARGDQGIPNDVIEIFTDSFTASQIQRGMIQYYDTRSDGLARFMIDTKQVMTGQMGQLGFSFDEYKLQYPQVRIRIVTNNFFDDFATAMSLENQNSAGRFLWILDFTSIYPGIITSNSKTHRTGDIEKLAQIDQDFACVMENPTQEVKLNSLTGRRLLSVRPPRRLSKTSTSHASPQETQGRLHIPTCIRFNISYLYTAGLALPVRLFHVFM